MMSIQAFITRENKPKVIILIGSVRMIKIGLIIALIRPKIIDVISAAVKLSNTIPLNKKDNK